MPKRYNFLLVVVVILIFAAVLYFNLKPKHIDLKTAERSVYSKNGMDGVLENIFGIIKPTHHYSVESGARNGIKNSNARHLMIHHDWGGLLIEDDEKLAKICEDNFKNYPKVKTLHQWIYPGNIELIFDRRLCR